MCFLVECDLLEQSREFIQAFLDSRALIDALLEKGINAFLQLDGFVE